MWLFVSIANENVWQDFCKIYVSFQVLSSDRARSFSQNKSFLSGFNW